MGTVPSYAPTSSAELGRADSGVDVSAEVESWGEAGDHTLRSMTAAISAGSASWRGGSRTVERIDRRDSGNLDVVVRDAALSRSIKFASHRSKTSFPWHFRVGAGSAGSSPYASRARATTSGRPVAARGDRGPDVPASTVGRCGSARHRLHRAGSRCARRRSRSRVCEADRVVLRVVEGTGTQSARVTHIGTCRRLVTSASKPSTRSSHRTCRGGGGHRPGLDVASGDNLDAVAVELPVPDRAVEREVEGVEEPAPVLDDSRLIVLDMQPEVQRGVRAGADTAGAGRHECVIASTGRRSKR